MNAKAKPAEEPTLRDRFADALRLIRTRKRISQTAASQIDGAPDFRTLSQWETRRKAPSMLLLTGYLEALGLDFHDLQDALDQVGEVGTTVGRIDEFDAQVDRLARVIGDLVERRLAALELQAGRDSEIGAELGRLAERVAAIEDHFGPS